VFTLADVYRAAGAPASPGAEAVTLVGAHYDSRRMGAGRLFVAMPGARVDGNDFIADAFRRGATAALCSRQDPAHALDRQVVTGDALAAFQRLAGAIRARSKATVVGVTGSNGKTTAKQAIAAALGADGPVLATERSENTDVGVPATLAGLRAEHRYAVLEMGAQTVGEIAAYCAFARPHAGVVTNISGAHLGLFKSMEAVLEAKSELLRALPDGGPLILNMDDAHYPGLRALARGPVTTFGRGEAAQIRVEAHLLPGAAGTAVGLHAGGASWRCEAPGLAGPVDLAFGAAFATARALGIPDAHAVAGLRAFQPAPHRMSLRRLGSGAVLLDDSYNANAASALEALATLRRIPAAGRKIAVLGDMFELGPFGPAAHHAVGRAAAGLASLVCVGALSVHYQAGALAAGMAPEQIEAFEADPASDAALTAARARVLERLRAGLRPDDVVLLKASNGMGFGLLAEALAADAPAPGSGGVG